MTISAAHQFARDHLRELIEEYNADRGDSMPRPVELHNLFRAASYGIHDSVTAARFALMSAAFEFVLRSEP